MHFSKDDCAKPGTIVIGALDKQYQDIIGKQEKPSKLDYKKICSKYKCDVCMGEKMDYKRNYIDDELFYATHFLYILRGLRSQKRRRLLIFLRLADTLF
ncbi:hypothetical protein ANCDUO_16082 [Ancylostoma duodenale]|uniref:Peptidase M12A domain-containing protein n=1 Tax=Ancylostoma duodenale TaxID=51022 RepID=A0A0C2CV99_9BILA|nr:hypothetical protein ANCDUO_16082 [Ancylostoma duodenale]